MSNSDYQRVGAALELQNLSKSFGQLRAVDDVSLKVAAGEFLALLGPSGSGKTSLLSMISGFEQPSTWPAPGSVDTRLS